MKVTSVKLELIPDGVTGVIGDVVVVYPTSVIALRFTLCGPGLWELLVSSPPQAAVPDGTVFRLTPATGHPSHTPVPIVTDAETTVTFIWDALRDGFDPSRLDWIKHHLTFTLTYANILCGQQPTADPPPPPPHIPPPIDIPDPTTPVDAPVDPGAVPVQPVEIDNPTYQGDHADETPVVNAGLDEEPTTEVVEDEVPGMPGGDVVTTDPAEIDQVPVADDPVETPSDIEVVVTDPSGVSSEDEPVDVAGDPAPEVFEVPSEDYVPTEPPGTSEGSTSDRAEEVLVHEDPGGDPGTPLPYPNLQDGTSVFHPISYNSYEIGDLGLSVAGKDGYLDAGSGDPLHLEVLPYEAIPYGEPAVVAIAVGATTTAYTDHGFVVEWRPDGGEVTTIGISHAMDFDTGQMVGTSFNFETSRFGPGSGVIRAIAMDTSQTIKAYQDKTVYLMPEGRLDLPPQTIDVPVVSVEEAIGGGEFVADGVLNETTVDPIFYMKAVQAVGGVAVKLHPYAAEQAVDLALEFGPFQAGGARDAGTDTGTGPLTDGGGLTVAPGTHHAILTELTLTPEDWYWVKVRNDTPAKYGPNHNFTLYAGGLVDPNQREAMPNLDGMDLPLSNPVIVHPQNALTALNADGSGKLAGEIYLPYEDQLFMVVVERTGNAVVVRADNVTDVQGDAVPSGVKVDVEVGDRVVVNRISSDQVMEIVGIFLVEQ